MFDSDKTKASLPVSKKVGNYTVHKLVLLEYADVFNRIEKLPAVFSDLPDTEDETIMKNLPMIITKCLPEVIGILAIITKEDEAKLGSELGLEEAIDVVQTAIEVNRFLEAWGKLKGLVPQIQTTIEKQSKEA